MTNDVRSFKINLLRELYAPLLKLTKCPVATNACSKIVLGHGNPMAKIMFIGEAPGRHEDEQGKPFVGRSGQLLTQLLKNAGVDRDEVFITNIVKCRPPNNRKPLPAEIAYFKPILIHEIKIIRPNVICALGASALESLTNDIFTMSSVRGNILNYCDTILIPTFHPAYVLRNQAALSDLQNDLIKIVNYAYNHKATG